MVFLRKKKVKGYEYLYLVKSTWDKKRKTSRQETIKYLGEKSAVSRDDIPEDIEKTQKLIRFCSKTHQKTEKNMNN